MPEISKRDGTGQDQLSVTPSGQLIFGATPPSPGDRQ
jgi:hypothetical protein